MNDSLSVILPIYNARLQIPTATSEWLEILPELTTEFELLLVDDGSTDQSDDVAMDLAHRYPQVRCLRHSRRRGRIEAIQTGIQRSWGQTILVADVRQPISPLAISNLWALRGDDNLVTARATPAPSGHGLVRRLMSQSASSRTGSQEDSDGQLQLIRRAALEELRARGRSSTHRVDRYTRTDLALDGGGIPNISIPAPIVAQLTVGR